MKKNVIICGLIAGLILCVVMVTSTLMCYDNPNFEGSMVLGFASMILAFSLIFVGVKNVRDNYGEGQITFAKAFKTGFYISFIASSAYVLVWLVEYYMFIPDFMEKYTEYELRRASESGVSAAELAEKTQEMAKYKEMYKNPLFVVLLTYVEVFPIGLIMTLIAALVLKRRTKPEVPENTH
jgi:hypothetical protein